MAESWKSPKKVAENQKMAKKSAESRKEEVSQKPEKAIFKSWKTGKSKISVETGKHF